MTKAQKEQLIKSTAFHIGILGVLCILTFARINNTIAPFAVAFLFACMFLRVNKVIIGICAFLFSLFVGHSQGFILSSAFAVMIFFALVWALPRAKIQYQNRKWWTKYHVEFTSVFAAYAFSHVLFIVFASGFVETLAGFVGLVIGGVFLAACLIFINAAQTRGNRIPWTIDQKICAGVFVAMLSLGLGGFDTEYFSVHRFVTVFLILSSATLLDARSTFLIAVCMGLGASFADLDVTPIAVYSLFALGAVAFRARTKYASVVAVVMIDLVLAFYFQIYFWYNIFDFLPVALACLLVLVLPKALGKHFDFSKNILSGYLVSKNTINKNRQGVNRRMENLGVVFNEMQNIYKGLVKGSLPPEDTAKFLARTVADSVCDTCENRPTCRRDVTASEMVNDGLEKLCYIGLQRGNVNFLDLPSDLSLKCKKVNSVLNMANTCITQVQTQAASRGKLDASKILMAGLLSGLSRLCHNFAHDLGSTVIFDMEAAGKIKDAMLGAGIVVSDCLITKSKSGEYSVSVLVNRKDAQSHAVEKVISKCLLHRMQVESIDDAETAGFAIVTCKTAPRYKLTFGVAQVAKDFNPQNGDTFSFLKVTSDKTLMALGDGMGAGARAKRASVLAISLIENFYKAGFSHEIILESVNQLLIITEQEDFSAIDMAVFSLNDGMVNFIKVGGVEGFIKRARDVEVIEAGSLPIGIVEEMVPKVTQAHLGDGDMVILCSDGVTDSFNDRAGLASYINNINATSPQALVDELMTECLRRTDKIAIDDITIIAAHLAPR